MTSPALLFFGPFPYPAPSAISVPREFNRKSGDFSHIVAIFFAATGMETLQIRSCGKYIDRIFHFALWHSENYPAQ